MKRSDPEIQQRVLSELKWDTRVEDTDVGVEVDAGIVTLTGTVSSWAKKVAAHEAAHRVAGVLDVANSITVKVPGIRTDTEIASAVRHALEWDVFVPDERIRSTVSRGWVTLEGDVDFWNQREDAERAVRNLSGVCAVSNKIEVKPSTVLPIPYDVRRSIEEALERQAEHEARRIDLQVHDGRVAVSGTVHSWAEKRAVIGAAKGTPGVRNVEDHLRIQP